MTGVATSEKLHQQYRRLALKYHPNTSSQPGAAETFSLLGEAYEVLSDFRRKAVYDKFGEGGLKGGVPQESGEADGWSSGYVYHGNPEKTFRQFFGCDNPFADFFPEDGAEAEVELGGLHGRRVKTQDSPIERDLHLSLDDLFHGCMKKIKISRRVMNEDGHTSSIKDKILTIVVKPGWNEGTRITFPKEGDQGPNSIPADIVFIVRHKSHPRFERKHNDLIYKTQISLEMALTGFSVEVATLDGKLLNIPVNDIVQPGYRKEVPGEGMPLAHDPSRRGNLIIMFDTQFPDTLSPERKQLIKRALRC